MPTLAQEAFTAHCDSLRALGKALEAAAAVRWEPSPVSPPVGGGSVPNPTLDTVLDPRRLGVSEEITRTTIALWPLTESVDKMTDALTAAVARWEGEA